MNSLLKRFFTTNNLKKGQVIQSLLLKRFPDASVKVTDISGGCAAMFEVTIESKEFKGLSTLKQHKLITTALREKIKDIHGLQIHTSIPIDNS